MSLLVILPPGLEVALHRDVRMAVETARPHGILPFHVDPDPNDLAQVLRRPPADLASEVTDYLSWRGLGVDRDTAHIIRRIVDLSSELRSVSAMSRSLYLSRRALGRRFMSRGLPVPSHWLQVARLLRVASKLQNSEATVASIAVDLGYPDGFSVSNQMERLVGHRPSEIRERLGWEWVLEAWLKREAEQGALTPTLRRGSRARPEPLGRRPERSTANTSSAG
jgi:AraC-like DNA-binding protein